MVLTPEQMEGGCKQLKTMKETVASFEPLAARWRGYPQGRAVLVLYAAIGVEFSRLDEFTSLPTTKDAKAAMEFVLYAQGVKRLVEAFNREKVITEQESRTPGPSGGSLPS